VAWDVVCRSIDEGGLNVKNLEIQNICLLLKFIRKLHMPNKSSWANWILSWVYGRQKRLGDNISRCTSSWHYLMTLIDMYRSLTFVRVGNGKSTCFWLDSWLGNKPLSIQYPTLFSHVQSPNDRVANCMSEHGWAIWFRYIMSRRAEEELESLLGRLDSFSLNDDEDARTMRFGPDKNFLVKNCYYALNFGGVLCAGNQEIWSSLAPKKCKIFAWLTLQDHLNTKERTVPDSRCPFKCQANEALTHMLFYYPHTSLWRSFDFQNLQGIQWV
jgi:hypothetical protein